MSRPFRYFTRVRYQDCDSQHVVFNARYGDYLDLALTEFIGAAMPDRQPLDPGRFEIQVKKQVIEWSAPARFQDVLEISTWVSRVGNSSFDVQFELRIAGKPDVLGIPMTPSGGGCAHHAMSQRCRRRVSRARPTPLQPRP